MSSGGYARAGRKPQEAPAPSGEDASEKAVGKTEQQQEMTKEQAKPAQEQQEKTEVQACEEQDKDDTRSSKDAPADESAREAAQGASASACTSTTTSVSASASSSSASASQAHEEEADDHPILIIEYQRLNKLAVDQNPHAEAELVMDGIYWEPTDIRSGDPYPLMEMLVAKPGEHYDNIAHVWNNSWGSLIGRPVDRGWLKMKGLDNEPLFGPEVDDDTDKWGWNYGTSFDRMDEAREGGRARKRMTDVCRSRLWKFGNKMPMPADWWAMVPKMKSPGGGAIEKVTSGTLAIAQQIKIQAVEKAGNGIISVGDSIGAQIKNVGKLVRNSARPGKEKEATKEGDEKVEKDSKDKTQENME